MSPTVQINERLAALTAAGTSVWLDQIRRSMIEGGELQRLLDEDSLRGETSNPAIFEAAIIGSPDYDDQLEQLAKEGKTGLEVYRAIAVQDVQMAADVLRPVWESSGGVDGYVSLEVAPDLARNTEGTIEEARMYWALVDRPNLMIKIPGTDEGVPAIEQMIYEGRNINVTLLFSVAAYEKVAEAFIRGLERRHAEGQPLSIHSVASFFVSRVDTEADARLEAAGRSDLAGRAGLANARAAYQRFKAIFSGPRWEALAAAGAAVQRPLWASTGVKNPLYSDTMYVDGLVAPDTVNTMPMATLLAAADHAEITGPTADQDPSVELQRLADAGLDLDDVTDVLLEEGIEKFVVAMDQLLAGIESRREAVVTQRPPTIESRLPSDAEPGIVSRIKRATADDVARRVWRKDATLWGPAGSAEIANRLGWLTIADEMRDAVAELGVFAAGCRADGLTDAVVLGMGGATFAAEVIRRSFGHQDGALRLQVLDTSDAEAIRAVQASVDIASTLFVVSSKSGTTVETLALLDHFRAAVDAAGGSPSRQFVAVTDLGSPLEDLANLQVFRRVFLNPPDMNGRYSALSYFGLVPAALMGADVGRLLDRAGVAEQASVSYDSSAANAGLWLGLTIGELAVQGRDKLTIVASDPAASFGLWVEQLIAGSTGKDGKGILPVAEEPLGAPDAYGEDRVFVYLRNVDAPDGELDAKVAALAQAGHPAITVQVHGPEDLGRLFFFSEFATAVAGWVLGINPFDQPSVREAKAATADVLATGELPAIADADDDALRALLAPAAPGRYVAIMGYVAPSAGVDAAVAELRAAIRDATHAATTFGYGPRFLHSTGQFHKDGPATGLFLQLVRGGGEDLPVPGAQYGFRTLEAAEAATDLQALRSHGLPAERVTLAGDDPAGAIRALAARIAGLI